jgi:Adaptor complexes medium subunit family
MRAHFGLPSVKNGLLALFRNRSDLHICYIEQDVEKRAPITVKFEIPYFTVSGIQVRYLKIVEKSGYQALPWVRYITQNGDDYRYLDSRKGRDVTDFSTSLTAFERHKRKAVPRSCPCKLISSTSIASMPKPLVGGFATVVFDNHFSIYDSNQRLGV